MENIMSFMNKIFGNPAPAQQPAQVQPGNIPLETAANMNTTTNPATAPNGTVPAGSPTSKDGSTQSSVADFSDLWQIDPTKATEQGQPLFNVDPNKLLETARLQSFRENVTPEQMAAIAAGGEAAVGAMMQLMEGVTQRGYAQSVLATTKLIEGALGKSNFAKADELDRRIRDVSVTSSLKETNPVFSNPAYAPMLETAQKQFQVKYPNATANELKQMAMNYLTSMADAIKPTAQSGSQGKAGKPAEDWSNFFNT